jgi:two-component system sensor histidine kinase DesK
VLSRFWRGRSHPERFDLYTRASLYPLSAAQPLLVALFANGLGVVVWVLLGFAVTQGVLCVSLVRLGLRHYLRQGPNPVRLLAVTTAYTVAASVASVALVNGEDHALESGEPLILALLAFVAPFVAALSIVVPVRVLTLVIAAIAGVSVASGVVTGTPLNATIPATISSCAAMIGVAAGYRGSAWMLRIVWELDRARQAQARLAVAEERLRFGRDLHDVVGRSLSVIVVKSELAAQLAKRQRPEAVDEMLAVRGVAEETLAELRELVRGYRTIELDTELAGARSLLTSAGIQCRILGDGADLSPAAQNALGWAVREGVTNVLRHSEAGQCTVAVRRDGDAVHLVMENDGVTSPATAPAAGTGLVGLSERVGRLGGAVSTERLPGGRFALSVRVPA